MVNFNDNFDDEEHLEEATRVNRRKVLLFLVPAVIVIGLSVGFYYAFNHRFGEHLNYSIVKNVAEDDTGQKSESVTVFYELPEVSAKVRKSDGGSETVKMKISLELSRVEDIPTVEGLLPQINDAVISHTLALTSDEISGSDGLYWLKEELLYRINLLVAPLKVSGLNFRNFEIQEAEQ